MLAWFQWWRAYAAADSSLRFQMKLAKLMKKHQIAIFSRDGRLGFQREQNLERETIITRRTYMQHFDLNDIINDQRRNPTCYLENEEQPNG